MFVFLGLAKEGLALYQCEGKEAFDSWSLANEVLKRRNKRHKRQNIYKCPHCRKFHQGSKTSKRYRL